MEPQNIYEQLKKDPEVLSLLHKGNDNLGTLGYTDHSEAHCCLVAERAARILQTLQYPAHDVELAKIAGLLHDIGNAVNRSHHAEYGALLAYSILERIGLSLADRVEVLACISNHDESTGGAVDPISAALIIADKTDVRRNRVRTSDKSAFDIHDRVNYAVTGAELLIQTERGAITLSLAIDEEICTMYEYFEIFLQRMLMCRRAAEMLKMQFRLTANGSKIL